MAQAALPFILGTTAGTAGAFFATAVGLAIDSFLLPRLLGGTERTSNPRLTSIQGFSGEEGVPIAYLQGERLLGSQAIWREENFTEVTETEYRRVGKGRRQAIENHRYFLSFAVAFCEGGPGTTLEKLFFNECEIEFTRDTPNTGTIGSGGNWYFFPGTEDQLPSHVIDQEERRRWMAGDQSSPYRGVPAFKGVAYIVFENLNLDDYHDRIPRIQAVLDKPVDTSNMLIPGADDLATNEPEFDWKVRAQKMTLGPGYGESVYEPAALRGDDGRGNSIIFNSHLANPDGDVITSLANMKSTFQNGQIINIPVTWFRNGARVSPGVETKARNILSQPWGVSGLQRDDNDAILVTGVGGTPSDTSILNLLIYLLERGADVELTCRLLAPDGSSVKDEDYEDGFFGNTTTAHFTLNAEERRIDYSGPDDDFGYRRMVLHYAALLRLADNMATKGTRTLNEIRTTTVGGVEQTETQTTSYTAQVRGLWVGDCLRGITRHREGTDSFPGAQGMGTLIRDAIALSGYSANHIGYIAAGNEYHSAQFPETGPIEDRFVYFNMNWIWRETTRIGIRWDLPLTNFRDSTNYDPRAFQFRSGEYWEYIYASEEDRIADNKTSLLPAVEDSRVAHLPAELLPINYNPFMGWKNISYWQRNNHRIENWGQPDGSRQAPLLGNLPDGLRGHSIDIFLSCRAVDKATNNPAVQIPPFSNGRRDDVIQRRFFEAAFLNRKSGVIPRSVYVEGWDARPFPLYPQRTDLFADTGRYQTGVALQGRTQISDLAYVIRDICQRSGLVDVDTSGVNEIPIPFTGYAVRSESSARELLEPLMAAYGFEMFESGGQVVFLHKSQGEEIEIPIGQLVPTEELPEGFRISRAKDDNVPSQVTINYPNREDPQCKFATKSGVSIAPGNDSNNPTTVELPVSLNEREAAGIADMLLNESIENRDEIELQLPAARFLRIEVGDILLFKQKKWRVGSIERGDHLTIKGRSHDPEIYLLAAQVALDTGGVASTLPPPTYPRPIVAVMDIPFFAEGAGAETGYFVAAYSKPFPPSVDINRPATDSAGNLIGFERLVQIQQPTLMGEILNNIDLGFNRYTYSATYNNLSGTGPLRPDRVDRETKIRVRLYDRDAQLQSVTESMMLDSIDTQTIAVQGTNNRWELKHWARAEFIETDADGYPIYELSVLVHGAFSTESLTTNLEPGDPIVFLNRNTMPFYVPESDVIHTSESDLVANASVEDPSSIFSTRIIRHRVNTTLAYPPPTNFQRIDLEDGSIRIQWEPRSFRGQGGDGLDDDDFILRDGNENYSVYFAGFTSETNAERIGFVNTNQPFVVIPAHRVVRYDRYFVRVWQRHQGRAGLFADISI